VKKHISISAHKAVVTRLKRRAADLQRRIDDAERQNRLLEIRVSSLHNEREFYAERLKEARGARRIMRVVS
jgi:FtsZ-binding cell division protein ZapB